MFQNMIDYKSGTFIFDGTKKLQKFLRVVLPHRIISI